MTTEAKQKCVCVFLLALLAGCAEPMTNDEVIAETRKCEGAGMTAQVIQDLAYRNIRVQCIPTNTPKPITQ